MQSPLLDSTQGRMTSGVACHRHPWTAPTVERRGAWHEITALGLHHGRSWHDITAIGQHTIGRCRAWHDITALGQHTRLDYVRRGMTSPPLYSTHDRTTSGVECHHLPLTAHMVERRRAWHDITSFGQRTRSNDVERDMPSPPLESTHGRTTSGVACHHHLWAAQTIERCRAWHAILPLGSTHGRTTSGVA